MASECQRKAGLSCRDNSGTVYSTYPLAPDFAGCGHPDPDHSYGSDRVAYNNGAMDEFLRAGKNDIFTIGYYRAVDIPFYAALAQSYTAYDRWHTKRDASPDIGNPAANFNFHIT